MEPFGVERAPILKVEEARNQVFETLLHLHGHFNFNVEILSAPKHINAEVVVFIEENKVDIELGLETIYYPILLVVVEAGHREDRVNLTSLFTVHF